MGHARKERVLLFGTDQRITSGPAARRPHSKAEYMTAPERFADSQIPLAPRAPSIHDSQIPLAPRAPSIHAPRAPSIHDSQIPLAPRAPSIHDPTRTLAVYFRGDAKRSSPSTVW